MKYTAEFDTDTKTCRLYVDGQAMDVYDFSISRYNSIDCGEGDTHTWHYLSFTLELSPGEKVSYNYSFKDGGLEYSESTNKSDLVAKVGEIHQMELVISSLAKALVASKR